MKLYVIYEPPLVELSPAEIKRRMAPCDVVIVQSHGRLEVGDVVQGDGIRFRITSVEPDAKVVEAHVQPTSTDGGSS